mmetsp:Transcript_95849/g.200345  ORF Transcript_95849/g.200345 Transcript_95849/m.200345 type:complete len:357 (-) Transcript_95849:138-1208(-)
MCTAAASSRERIPRSMPSAFFKDVSAALSSPKVLRATERGSRGSSVMPVMSGSSSGAPSKPSLRRSKYILWRACVSAMKSPILSASPSSQPRAFRQPSFGSHSICPRPNFVSALFVLSKMLGLSQNLSPMAAGLLWSICSTFTSEYFAKRFLSSFFVAKLSLPHQAKTMPLFAFLHSARIASTTASMTGSQNFACSRTALPALSALSSGGNSVQAAFMKSTPCVNSAVNHSAGGTTFFSFSRALRSAVGVDFSMPYLYIAAALMMQRIVTQEPKRESVHSFTALSKWAIPVADSNRGKGDCPKDTTRQFDGGFGLRAWRVISLTGTIRLLRPGPMYLAASGSLSMTGRSTGSQTDP